MKLSFLNDLPVSSTIELCKEAANFAKKADNSSSLPKLELLLYNGTSVTGKIVDFQDKSGKSYIWIENNIDIPQKISLLLLDISQIIGINIMDFEVYQICREGNKPLEIIGTLELKRKKKSTEELLEKLLSKAIVINFDVDTLKEEDRAILYKNLSLITTTFQEILSDEMSKSSIKEKISEIEITIEEHISVVLNKEILSIAIQKSNRQTIANQVKILQEKIENVF